MKKKIAVLSCGWSYYFINDFINGMRENLKETSADIYLLNCYDHTECSGYPNLTGYSDYKQSTSFGNGASACFKIWKKCFIS